MKMGDLDKQLAETHEMKERSWGKLLAITKRYFDNWAIGELVAHGYNDFKMGYMPLLANIHPQGITNNELAKKAKVTKQAMSKVVKELVANNYIKTQTNGTDKRSAVIFLTPKGKKLVLAARYRVFELEKEYEQVIGKESLENIKEVLQKIIGYHESLEKNDK